MKIQKCVILTLALVTGIFGISLSAPGNDAQKISTPPSAYTPRTRTYYIAAENTDLELCADRQRPNDRQAGASAMGQAIGL